MPCIYRYRWHDDYPPMVIIAGSDLRIDDKEGVIWQGHNRKRCRRILLYRTPGITPEMFEKRTVEGTRRPLYIVRYAKIRWTRLGKFETSVFLVPPDGSRARRITYIWVGCGKFSIVPRFDGSEVIINDVTFIDRKRYHMCVSWEPIWVDDGEFVYSMMDFSVTLLGRKDEVAARAEEGDEECKKFMQKTALRPI